MRIGGRCECRSGAVVVCAAAIYATMLRISGDSILIGSKFCGKSDVLINPYRAWVVRIAIAPLRKMIPVIGSGRNFTKPIRFELSRTTNFPPIII